MSQLPLRSHDRVTTRSWPVDRPGLERETDTTPQGRRPGARAPSSHSFVVRGLLGAGLRGILPVWRGLVIVVLRRQDRDGHGVADVNAIAPMSLAHRVGLVRPGA